MIGSLFDLSDEGNAFGIQGFVTMIAADKRPICVPTGAVADEGCSAGGQVMLGHPASESHDRRKEILARRCQPVNPASAIANIGLAQDEASVAQGRETLGEYAGSHR